MVAFRGLPKKWLSVSVEGAGLPTDEPDNRVPIKGKKIPVVNCGGATSGWV